MQSVVEESNGKPDAGNRKQSKVSKGGKSARAQRKILQKICTDEEC